jgi:hypothetical protein
LVFAYAAHRPRCIVEGVCVDTPSGRRAIETFRPGDEVWTWSEHGGREAGRITAVAEATVDAYLRILDLSVEPNANFCAGGVLVHN